MQFKEYRVVPLPSSGTKSNFFRFLIVNFKNVNTCISKFYSKAIQKQCAKTHLLPQQTTTHLCIDCLLSVFEVYLFPSSALLLLNHSLQLHQLVSQPVVSADSTSPFIRSLD